MFVDVNVVSELEAVEKINEADNKMLGFVGGKVSINTFDAMNTYMAGVMRGMYMVVLIMKDSKKALAMTEKLEKLIDEQIASHCVEVLSRDEEVKDGK